MRGWERKGFERGERGRGGGRGGKGARENEWFE